MTFGASDRMMRLTVVFNLAFYENMSNILAIHASDAEPLLERFRSVFGEELISFVNVEDTDVHRLRFDIREASLGANLCIIFSSDRLMELISPLRAPRADWIDQYLLADLGTLSLQLNLTSQSRIVRVLCRDLFHAVRVWPSNPWLYMDQDELTHSVQSLRSLFEKTLTFDRFIDLSSNTIRFENLRRRPAAAEYLNFETGLELLWLGHEPRIVELLFATNRAPVKGAMTRWFGPDRAEALAFGACRVRIPEDHRIGHLELPKKTNWLKLRFTDEAVDETRHFVVKRIGVFDRNTFCDIIQGEPSKTALVFVHGFNTTFEGGVLRLAQIAWDMQFKGAPILFSWPSAGGVLNYLYDLNSALGARPRFQELIQMLRADAGVETIHIVAHSMGNFVVLDALNDLAKAGSLPNLAEIVMAAPDVDVDLYKILATNIRPLTRGMTLYASSNDKALVVSRKAAGKPRAGDVFSGSPILLPNIESIDVSAIGDEMFGLNHNVFADNRSLIDDIGRLLFRGERPPDQRSPQIRCVPEGAIPPDFWRYVV
ncbi:MULTISPECIES: alpha/beta hydrolase [unclassified Bradyrhizobium]|uniref:alpha/beta hydrolase n=1 Tax=unclassified Bradyrhizobium TaxID=2631580 RepID=UPI0028EBD1B8|nr:MULTISPECIES: alpha/beta hydrolase [unclassified Bradyrhizobium]